MTRFESENDTLPAAKWFLVNYRFTYKE
ncbi:hypothetical protein MY4824_003877 [Beauveria thailandica]